jgi:hypothetical protein
MLTIKKIIDRKTQNTDVVIRMSFRESLRFNSILERLVTEEHLKVMSDDTEAFGNRLRTYLDTITNDCL